MLLFFLFLEENFFISYCSRKDISILKFWGHHSLKNSVNEKKLLKGWNSIPNFFLFLSPKSSYFPNLWTIPIAGDPANFTQIFLFYANDTIAHCFALVNGSRGGTTTTPNGAFGSYNGRPNMVDSSHFPFSRECHHKLKEINRCLILFVSKKKKKKRRRRKHWKYPSHLQAAI